MTPEEARKIIAQKNFYKKEAIYWRSLAEQLLRDKDLDQPYIDKLKTAVKEMREINKNIGGELSEQVKILFHLIDNCFGSNGGKENDNNRN